jgi:hypothetical protein
VKKILLLVLIVVVAIGGYAYMSGYLQPPSVTDETDDGQEPPSETPSEEEPVEISVGELADSYSTQDLFQSESDARYAPFDNIEDVDPNIVTPRQLVELMLEGLEYNVSEVTYGDASAVMGTLSDGTTVLVLQFDDALEADECYHLTQSQLLLDGYHLEDRLTYDEQSLRFTKDDSSFYLLLYGYTVISGAKVRPRFQETDFGTITAAEAPTTWEFTLPEDYTRVETAIYGYGKDEANSYGGWNAYMKVNDEYVWKFMMYDQSIGAIIQDFTIGEGTKETEGRGKWLDITSYCNPGENTLTYYHYTSGDGIGVKMRVYTGP